MADQLVPALTHVVNLSLTHAHFPALWKTAKVIPLLKKSDETQAKNYRPVSLLTITSKILERAVYHQLIEYLETNKLIHHSHHGFRKHHSTTTALLEMHSNWVQAYEENKVTAVVLLDMSAAFDLVDKSILIGKLKLYGLDDHSSTWVENYMSVQQIPKGLCGWRAICPPASGGWRSSGKHFGTHPLLFNG